MKRGLGIVLAVIGGVGVGLVLSWGDGRKDDEVARGRPASTEEVQAKQAQTGTPSLVSESQRAPPEPAPEDPGACVGCTAIDRLRALLDKTPPLSEEDRRALQEAEDELRALGPAAVPALARQLAEADSTPAARDRLFNILRNIPGGAAERVIVDEAVSGVQNTTRTMAIESLGVRKTDVALEALSKVARDDPTLPAQPLIAQPRGLDDPSTELPDEQVFTPRMKAMTALASTGDARAVEVLADIARHGPDEALRMEAARNLGALRDHPRTLEALRVAAASDPSPYVRLAALHSLHGVQDAALVPVLTQVATRDRDLGVRTLAAQVLEQIHRR